MPPERNRLDSVSIDDVDLPYVDQGEGEPVLFVHGSISDYRIWDDHREIIASRYRVIAMSQRYFGMDPWPDSGENFCIQIHGDDLGAFIRGLGVAPVNIVGWSYGAAVCLTMAIQNRDLAKRMFLYEPTLATFVTEPADAKAALEDRMAMSADAKPLADAGDFAGAVRMFVDGVNAEVGTFDRLPPAVRAMMINNARMLPLLFAGPPPPSVTATDLRDLTIPITMVLGKQSRTLYRIAALEARALLPSAELKIVGNARHLWPIQDPPAFSRLVLDFLDQD